MTISSSEWESIYTAINKARGQGELTEGIVNGYHEDGVRVFVEGFGTEPVAIAALEYSQTVYEGSTKTTMKPMPKRPEIGQRVLVARPGGSLHNPRIIGIVMEVGTWEQPSDIQIPQWPVGSGMIWYTDIAPAGWLVCDGSAIPAQFTKLIALLGPNLPDMRGRVPAGRDPAQDPLFHLIRHHDGANSVMLAYSNMPLHDHEFDGTPLTDHAHTYEANHSVAATVGGPTFNAQRASSSGGTPGTRITDGVDGPVLTPAGTISEEGGTLPHNNLQPYTVVNFIVKT